MNTHLYRAKIYPVRSFSIPITLILSVLGLIIGIWLSVIFSRLHSGYIVSDYFVIPAYFHLLLSNLIPLVLVSFIFFYRLSTIFYLMIFTRFICHGFCGITIYYLIGNSAWLIRRLLMFSSCATSVVIFWLLFRSKQGRRPFIPGDVAISIISICAVTIFDFFAVSPFLEPLLIYY